MERGDKKECEKVRRTVEQERKGDEMRVKKYREME